MSIEPRYPWVWYGNGFWAECRRMMPQRKENLDGWWMQLNISEEIKQYYQIPVEDYDEEGFIWVWYSESEVTILNNDPSFGRVFIETGFKSEATPYSRRNIEFKHKIILLEKENESLRSGIAYLMEENQRLQSNVAEYVRGYTRIQKEMKSKTDDEAMFDMERQGGEYTNQ